MFGGGLGGKIFGGGGGGGKFCKSIESELTESTGSLDRVLFGTLDPGVESVELPLFPLTALPRSDLSAKTVFEGFDETEGLGTAPG